MLREIKGKAQSESTHCSDHSHPVSTGEVGDWQNHFTPEQNAMFDTHYQTMMADEHIPFRFLI